MDIEFKRAGLTLRGKLAKPNSATFDLALILHGFTDNLGYTPDHLIAQLAARLNQVGLATLRFDFNGHGKSDGDFAAMTVLNELEDAMAALAFAKTIPGVCRIFVVGHSQGGVVGTLLAGTYPDQIAKLVLLAPAITLKDDARRGNTQGNAYDPHHLPDALTLWNGLTLGGDYLRVAQWLPIDSVAARFGGQVCLIHGTADTVVTPEASRHLQAIWPTAQLHLLEGADHGFGGASREQAVALTAAFLGD